MYASKRTWRSKGVDTSLVVTMLKQRQWWWWWGGWWWSACMYVCMYTYMHVCLSACLSMCAGMQVENVYRQPRFGRDPSQVLSGKKVSCLQFPSFVGPNACQRGADILHVIVIMAVEMMTMKTVVTTKVMVLTCPDMSWLRRIVVMV